MTNTEQDDLRIDPYVLVASSERSLHKGKFCVIQYQMCNFINRATKSIVSDIMFYKFYISVNVNKAISIVYMPLPQKMHKNIQSNICFFVLY